MRIMTLRLKPADLLFVKTIPNDGDEFAAAISESTGAYSHVAIVTSETTIIHATLKYGVIEETLADFLSEHTQVECFRMLDIDAPTVVVEAKKHLVKPYNNSFYPDADGFYCSQLVVTTFANQIKLPESAMSFGSEEILISDYWQAYFDQLGLAVPLGKLGSNPDELATYSGLDYIGMLSDAN